MNKLIARSLLMGKIWKKNGNEVIEVGLYFLVDGGYLLFPYFVSSKSIKHCIEDEKLRNLIYQ
jgi:hypothetical protein